MKQREKEELIYLAMKDIFNEFNHSVNHLLVLREFLSDVFNYKNGKDFLKFDYPSVEKSKKKVLAKSCRELKVGWDYYPTVKKLM